MTAVPWAARVRGSWRPYALLQSATTEPRQSCDQVFPCSCAASVNATEEMVGMLRAKVSVGSDCTPGWEAAPLVAGVAQSHSPCMHHELQEYCTADGKRIGSHQSQRKLGRLGS